MKITSRQNPKIKALRALRQGRGPWDSYLLLEGDNLIEEAIKQELKLKIVFQAASYNGHLRLEAPEHYLVPDDLFSYISGLDSPQGLLVLCEKPQYPTLTKLISEQEVNLRLLVLENLQDPGNLGTLMRSAKAFGFAAVLQVASFANPYQEKVLRASVGTALSLPVYQFKDASRLISLLKNAQVKIVASCLEGASALQEFKLPERLSLWVGNEGQGLSADIIAAADYRLKIPMSKNVESLNAAVAGSIMMYEMANIH